MRALYVAVTLLLLSALYPAPVSNAQSTTTSGQTQTPTTIAERVKKRVEARKTELNAGQITSLKQKCRAAQSVITVLRNNATRIESTRLNTYDVIKSNSAQFSQILDDQKVDKFELGAQIEKLNQLIESFREKLYEYTLALDDAAGMDCVSDPPGFRASIDTARDARESLRVASDKIEKQITDTMAVTFARIKSSVGQKK